MLIVQFWGLFFFPVVVSYENVPCFMVTNFINYYFQIVFTEVMLLIPVMLCYQL